MQPGVEARGYVKIMTPLVDWVRRSAKVSFVPVWVSRGEGPPRVSGMGLPTLLGERGVLAVSDVVGADGADTEAEVSTLPVSGGFSRSSVAGGRFSSVGDVTVVAAGAPTPAAGVGAGASEVAGSVAGAGGVGLVTPGPGVGVFLPRIGFPGAACGGTAAAESPVVVAAPVVASGATAGAGAAGAALLSPMAVAFALPLGFFTSAPVAVGTVAPAPVASALAGALSVTGTVAELGAVPAVSGTIPVSPVSTAAGGASSTVGCLDAPSVLPDSPPAIASLTLEAARLAFPTTPVGAGSAAAVELSAVGSGAAAVGTAFALEALLFLVAGAGAGGSRCGRFRSSTILRFSTLNSSDA